MTCIVEARKYLKRLEKLQSASSQSSTNGAFMRAPHDHTDESSKEGGLRHLCPTVSILMAFHRKDAAGSRCKVGGQNIDGANTSNNLKMQRGGYAHCTRTPTADSTHQNGCVWNLERETVEFCASRGSTRSLVGGVRRSKHGLLGQMLHVAVHAAPVHLV